MCNDENNMIELAVFPVPSPPPTPPPLATPPSYPPALPNGLQLPAPPPLPQQVGPGSGGPGLGPVPHSLPPAPSPPSPLLMPELINESGDSIVTLERGRSIDGALLAATIGGLCLCCCCCIAFCGVILYARKRFGAGNEKRWIHYKLAHSNPVWPMLYLPKDVREGLRNELYSRTVPIRRLLSRKSDPAWPAEIVMGWADITAAEEAEAAEAAEFQAEADQALAESRLITRIMRQKAANAAACGGDDGELHVDEPLPQPACVLKPQKKAPPPGRRRRSRQLPVDEKEGGSRLGASGHRRHSHQLPVFRLKVGPAAMQTGVEGEAGEALAESRPITAPTRQLAAHAAGSGGDDGELHVDEPSPQPARVLKPQRAPPPPRGARLSGPGVLDTNIASLTKFFETEGKDKAEMEGAARPRRRNQGSEGREGEGGGTNAPFCTRRQRRSHQLPVSTAGTAALARARQSRGDSGGIPPQAAVEDDGSFTDCRTASQNGVVEASMGRERPVSAAGKAALTRARHRRGDSDNSPPPGAVDDGESSPDDYPVEFQEARPRGGADAESPTAAVRVRGEQTPRPPPPPPPYEEDPLVYDDYRI